LAQLLEPPAEARCAGEISETDYRAELTVDLTDMDFKAPH